ncbi:ABC transporter substrate-binding protein [Nocardia sp. NBC_01730]|uniref:ABC transporter substrate-binding protein n=1 Tax=Nocardia sp. NBC_01730 TaxID=2975998 RepID=UPI002E134088|nr:ABC transporter substrate-binding protein [Nocardia sp. NBC_01730]
MLCQPPSSRLLVRMLATVAALVTLSPLVACGTEQSAAPGTTTLTVAIQATPSSLDPAQLDDTEQGYLWSALYDTLLQTDNTGKPQPNAAESWSYSGDARTLTMKLRAGMTFTSGAPVNAAAVEATIERTKATPGQVQGLLSTVSTVQAPDDTTVVLELSRPDAGLLPALAMGAGVIADPATVNQERTALNPVASGPYTLDTAQTVNGSVYVLHRRDDHWNAAYPFRTVNIRVLQDCTATFNALQAGEVNAGSAEIVHVDRLKALGFRETTVQANSLATLVLVDRKGELLPPLGDLRVRTAINKAFDRQKIIDTLLRGSGKSTVQPFNPKGPGYDPALEKTYTYDVEAANRLMSDAGYPNGFAVTIPEVPYAKPFTPTVTQALAAIGINVTWEPIPSQQSTSAFASKKYPMYLNVEAVTSYPRELSRFQVDSPRNAFRTEDPKLTALVNRYNSEQDPAAAAPIAKQISAFLVANAWDALLFDLSRHWMTKDGIVYLGDGTQAVSNIRLFGLTG